jgi:hypothetical protein
VYALAIEFCSDLKENYTSLDPLITIDNSLTLLLASVCQRFWRALKMNERIRKSLFRVNVKIGLVGETYDSDMSTYFPGMSLLISIHLISMCCFIVSPIFFSILLSSEVLQ